MEEYTHSCIKCQTEYKDEDPDPYYCENCNKERKIVAKEIDRKIALQPSSRPIKSDLQIYDEICKLRGSKFVSIKDLGIKL